METKKKVLIVDDQRPILTILGIKLRIAGYDITTAQSGVEALRLFTATPPDMVLLDVIMPDMDGFEVLRQIRRVSKTPVIAFSARPETGTEALKLGADDFIAKPFDVDYLVQRIRRLLDSKKNGTKRPA